MTKRTKSSQRWIERQRRDPFVRKAADRGLASRAHFKLAQLDARHSLLRPHMWVLELGAAPGGWTRYLASRLSGGHLIAVDYRPMQVPLGVVFLGLDIYSDEFSGAVQAALGARKLDLVLSDMSPNITGVRAADQAAAMGLIDLATDAAIRWLKPGGALVVKMFQGEGVDDWVKAMRRCFEKAQLAKPAASRSESREVYGIATGFSRTEPAQTPSVAGPTDV
jgi:23S rRNA (uridine2552-2'-O)-methyltransferase